MSAGTATSVSRSRPDADARMPSASNPASRSTPGDSRSTSRLPTTGASSGGEADVAGPSSIRALTSANRSAGSHVVNVFSPVTR